MEETSRRSILGRHQSCYEERIEVLSDSIERNYPAYCIPKVVRMKTGEVLYEKVYMKDLLETRMEKRIGFRTRSKIRSWATL